VWPYYGADEVNYITTPEGSDLLKTLATIHTAPVHVRNHFLLNTGDGTPGLKWGSTNAYTEDTSGNPVYNFQIVDQIMDSITGAGAFPLVEIAFMPQALSSAPAGTPYRNSSTYALDSGSFYPPTDYNKWRALIDAWARHTQIRYPTAAANWLWELWNEPNLNSGTAYWHGAEADFFKLYDYTEAALHGVLPNAQLGGPEIAGVDNWLTDFLQHCANGTNAASGRAGAGARLDLVTFHAKGGTTVTGGNVEMNMGNQLRQHLDGFQRIAAFSQFKSTPIIIGEADPDGCAACPISMTPADAYRNSPAYGAYEVAMMKRTLELEAQVGVNVRGLVTWGFTFPGTPYFAGYRAMATNGIHLPVLNAFKLLGSLTGNRLPVTSSGARSLADILANSVRGTADVDAMAARDGSTVKVLVWNYHDDLVTVPATSVQVAVTLPAGFGARATITHLRVDEMHGDAYTVWTGQGSPSAPTPAQRAALVAAMEPPALTPASTLDVPATGPLMVSFDLPRFGVSLLTITPPASAPPDGGGTGGSVDGGGGAGGATTGGGGAGDGGGAGGGGAGAGGSAGGSGGAGGGGASGSGTGGASAGGAGSGGSGRSGCSCATAPGAGGGALVALAGVLAALARVVLTFRHASSREPGRRRRAGVGRRARLR
jgi:xylan 1,4-beta-xylosidase